MITSGIFFFIFFFHVNIQVFFFNSVNKMKKMSYFYEYVWSCVSLSKNDSIILETLRRFINIKSMAASEKKSGWEQLLNSEFRK